MLFLLFMFLIHWLCPTELPAKITAQSAMICKRSSDLLDAWKTEHEPELWAALAKENITPAAFNDAQKRYVSSYNKTNIDAYIDQPSYTPGAELDAIITTACNDCGVDRNAIKIRAHTGFSPAAATDSILFINESAFMKFPKNMWPFMIAHELQHMINKDGSTYYALERLTSNQKLLNTFRRFCELRADMGGMNAGAHYAQSAHDFFSYFLTTHGEEKGTVHPKIQTRLACAECACKTLGTLA